MTESIYQELREERKKQQELGLLPDWFTTNGWQMFKEKYLWEADSFKEQVQRIAKTAAKHTPRPKTWEKKFFDVIWNGWLACSTPVLANMGTDRGCPVSCSGSFVGDSVFDFYDCQTEAAILSKHGFGTSSYLGDIRPRGSKIGSGGTSSGVLPVFKDFVQLSRDISQGGIRRGSWAGYLEIEHGDFWEIVNYIQNNPDDANIGWVITDSYIGKLEKGDEEALARFQRALKVKCLTGKGYFWFVDKVNRQMPDCYKKHNLYNKGSNLCVAPETLILTSEGYRQISLLQDKEVKVWNGEEFSSTTIRKTNTNQELLRITTKDGYELECTPYHKFYDESGKELRASELETGVKLLKWKSPEGQIKTQEIQKVENLEERKDTYCFTEPKRNMGVFNGILTGNCSEIALFADEEHTFSCVLSSMNLAKYDEWKDTDAVYVATVFLDCVASEFIRMGKNIRGLEKTVRFTEKSRALGLGTLGFHTYLQQNMIAIEDFQAHMKNLEIFKHMHDESLRASMWMAEKWGEPEWCKGFGVRNSHRLAIAPNTSSALICGSVSQGIEPVYKNVFTQGSAAGELDRINPVLVNLMKERGVFSDETINSIIKDRGSVRNQEWLNDEEKLVFKTAFEIDQKTLLRLASSRQKYICQAQSLNLFFAADEEESYIAEVHKEAFLDPAIKSLYYLRSLAGVYASKDECLSCHG